MNTPAADETQLWLPLGEGGEDEEHGRSRTGRPMESSAVRGRRRGGGAGQDRTHPRGGGARLRVREQAARALPRLGRVHEPAIVFTEYRGTADRLREALEGRWSSRDRSARQPRGAERRIAIAEFNSGDALLVATDAASEGLNLQHRCRLVIHFELPWMPSTGISDAAA